MSRSIHTTRRAVRELLRRKHAGLADPSTALNEVCSQMLRKRRIKQQVSAERRRADPPLAGTPVDTIPIEVLDTGTYVHHPASPDDLREVLKGLPDAARDGIAKIQLSLGREHAEESRDEDPLERDPFVGRVSAEVFPGVFGGSVLGCYRPKTGLVCLYAYVYDDHHLPLPRPLCEVYLRLQALKTFVHEVAHHHDDTQRVRRGRWLSDRKPNFEWYAEQREHVWSQDVVIPYLQRAYPEETRALRKWVAHRGGWMPPLAFFAGDTRRTERNGLERIVFPTSSAFESWVAELPQCPTLAASRLAFAQELHYADKYAECLTVLDRVLTSEPSNVTALTWKADTLLHLERLDQALAAADAALSLQPGCAEAWEARGGVFECRQDWQGALDNCVRWEAAGRMRRAAQREIWICRAIAYCALDDQPRMEECLKAHLATFSFRNEESAGRRASFARKCVFRRASRPLPPAPPPSCHDTHDP